MKSKRNVTMTRATCVVCDEPLGYNRIINVCSFTAEDEALLKIDSAFNAAYCSSRCADRVKRAIFKILKENHEERKAAS